MKKAILVLIFIALCLSAWAQCPPSGSLFLDYQHEVDDFAVNYPNCTELPNIVRIGQVDLVEDYSFYITNLDGLSGLTSIKELIIRKNEALTDITGLSNLNHVESLTINDNPNLASFTGLEGLNSLRILQIFNSPIANLSDLENLSSVESFMNISDCDNLTSLTGLENISTMGSLGIGNCDNLTSLTGLENVSTIGGSLRLSENNNLTSLAGFENISAVEMNLEITRNSNLTTLMGLENIENIGENLKILFNDSLTTLTGLENLESVGGNLDIFGNVNLTTLKGLENLSIIEGNLGIINTSLTTLLDLENLTDILGSFSITSNWSLSSCEIPTICNNIQNGNFSNNAPGCNSTAEVEAACMPMVVCPDGGITFRNQQEIDDFVVNYPNCTELNGHLDIGSLLDIYGNDIEDITPLSNITSIGGSLGVFNVGISSFDGLNNLTSIGGDLWIEYVGLTTNNFTGLENLTTIGEDFLIAYTNLTDFNGLENLSYIGEDVSINQNHQLSTCDIQTICDYLENGGTATINNNAPGCNSQAEVEAACMPVVVCPTHFTPFSQQEVDDFPSNYPNCTTINHLDLTFPFDITNLDSLAQLTTIAEDVFIGLYGPNNINDISGLQNVTSIGGILVIDDTQLTDLSGLQSLTSASVLQISNNPNLTTLSGLENLDAATLANASIGGNDNLSICNLTNICTYLADGGTVDFNSNALGCNTQAQVETTCSPVTVCPDSFEFPTQQGIDDFPINYPGCIEIPGNVRISLDMIDNLDGLSQIASIEGNLTIESSDLLELTADISGLQNLTTIGGNLRILTDYFWTNPSLDAFQNLTSIGGNLDFSNNGFTDLSPLENLTSIGGTLSISGEYLTSLNGLENIDYTTITDLQIDNNGNLSYCHLPNICEYIENGGTTNISGNATGCATQNQVESRCISETACLDIFSASSQQEIDDFPSNYPNCTAVGHLDLHFPGDITNLDSLIQLTSVTDYVEIGFFEPNNIADISGLKNITSIGGYLQITGTQLTDLSGFQNLTSIGDYLWIYFNPNLLSLSGLENLDPATIGSLDISANDNLSVCSLSNICTYLNEGLGAYNSISGNSSGCNSETEVQADCSPTPPDNPCGGTTSSTDSLSHIFDQDLFIDGIGFANNPSITFPAPNANTTLSDISLELYFRLNGNSCENEIAIQLTDPAGNTQALTAYTTCDGGTGLFYVNLDVPSGSTTGSVADWVVEFDDTNDQNSDYEYSVRFARLNYVATSGGGSGETVVNEVSEIADMDLFIDGVGFENNPSVTFADPGTPADAVLSDISLELYFRLNGASCENEIALQLTDPAGNTQALTAYTTCDGGTGLFYVNLDVPSGNTTGSAADWVLQFDDTNDQNSDYEYSVRFGRLTYTTTHTEGGVATPVIITDEVVRTADSDLFIDGVGFDNNATYTFYDPATPEIATLSDIQLELYFRLNGSSCENEIALQLTDPAGNTQALTAYTTCDGGTGLYYVNLDVPSGSVTGEIAPWIVQFDDTNDQNSDYEYSVRFGRLTYTTQYDLCETQMMIVEENEDEQQFNNPSTQRLNNTSTRQLHNPPLKLYPVPASQHLNIEYISEVSNSTNIEIISNEGKTLISSQEFSQEGINTIQLDINDLPAGHYHIRMDNSDDMQMQSFVKIAP